MAIVADLAYRINLEGEASATRGLRRMQGQMRSTSAATAQAGGGLSRLGGILKGLPFLAVAGGVAVAIKGFNALTDSASAAEEIFNRFATVFGPSIDAANAAVEDLSERYGLATTEARQFLSSVGDIAVGLGAEQDAALSLSEGITQLGADLASFTNYAGGTEGAVNNLTSAILLGESQAGKSLGVILNETVVKDYADSIGVLYGDLDLAGKAQLRLQYAVEQSQNAIGDAERTMDSFANQQRRLKSDTQNAREAFGALLLPIRTEFIRLFRQAAQSSRDFADRIREIVTSARGIEVIGAIFETVGQVFGVVRIVFREVGRAIRNIVDAYEPYIQALFGAERVTQKNNESLKIFSVVVNVVSRALQIAVGTLELWLAAGAAVIQTVRLLGESFTRAGRDAIRASGSFSEALRERLEPAAQQAERAGARIQTALDFSTGFDNFEEEIAAAGDAFAAVGDRIATGIAGPVADGTTVAVAKVQEGTAEIVEETEKIRAAYGGLGDFLRAELGQGFLDAAVDAAGGIDAVGGRLEELTAEANERAATLVSGLSTSFDQVADIATGAFRNQLAAIDALTAEALSGEEEATARAIDAVAERERAGIITTMEAAAAREAIEAASAERITEIERDAARRRYQIELEQFNFNKAKSIAEAIIGTASAVVANLAIPPLAVAIGALGAVQIGIIAGQAPPPPPQLQAGGIVNAFPGGREVIVGEGGSAEAVIPLNERGVAVLAEALRSAGVGGGSLRVVVNLNREPIIDVVNEGIRRGRVDLTAAP